MFDSVERSRKSVSVISISFDGNGITGNLDPDCLLSGLENTNGPDWFCFNIFFVSFTTFSASLVAISSSESDEDDDEEDDDEAEDATTIVWLCASFSDFFFGFATEIVRSVVAEVDFDSGAGSLIISSILLISELTSVINGEDCEIGSAVEFWDDVGGVSSIFRLMAGSSGNVIISAL